jgi:hypothetical protein
LVLKTISFIILFFSLSAAQYPAEPIWPVQVNAVFLKDNRKLEVENGLTGKFKVDQSIIVYNENGKSRGHFVLNENKYIKIKDVKGKIVDQAGNTLKNLDKDDIIKANISPGYILYDDSKYQGIELEYHTYPYIVEFEYELELASLYYWPSWYPQDEIPVLESNYTLEYDQPFEFHKYTIGIQGEPKIITDGKHVTQTWTLKNIEPLKKEDWMPPESRVQMALFFTPAQFKLEQYFGNFDSWTEFGKWGATLFKGRSALSPELGEQVRLMTADAASDKEKISILYEYLQNSTRYVAISLGIGGLQPHPAMSVFLNKYGDCKDLTTLMIGMAREVGINAYPVLVKTRNEGIVYPDFPSFQFNHVICLVSLENDSMWLECTVDNLQAGELPPQDEGCFVLVLSALGGKLVQTPLGDPKKNGVTSRIEGTLLNDASLIFSGSISYQGNSAFSRRTDLSGQRPEKISEWIASNVLGKYAPKLIVNNCQFQNCSENYELPLITTFDGTIEKFAAVSKNRIFFNPALLHRETAEDIPKEKERKYPINYNFPFILADTFRVTLPSGYELEAAPDRQDINASFGRYIMDYQLTDKTLEYVRFLRIDQKQVPPEDYPEYLEFMKTVVKTDKSKFVLVKKG